MIAQQLLSYIREQLQKGASYKNIKTSLITAGWKEIDVEQAFASLNQNPIQPTSQTSPLRRPSLVGVKKLLTDSVDLYKRNLRTFWGIMIVPTAAMILATSLLGIFKRELSSVGFLSFIVIAILSFVIQAWGYVALLYGIKDSGQNIGIKESFKRGQGKILSYVWVIFLVLFITNGGFFLFLVPGIVFSVWFSFATFVLVSENLKGMTALLKSREYVKGRWLAIFGRLLPIFFLSVLFTFGPALILYFSGLPFIVISFILSLILFIFMPLFVTYLYFLYGNLRCAKGEFTFSPRTRSKLILIIVGLLGVILGPIIMMVTGFASGLLIGLLVSQKNLNLDKIDLTHDRKKELFQPDQSSGQRDTEKLQRDSQRTSHLLKIQHALTRYYDDKGSYPPLLTRLISEYLPEGLNHQGIFDYQYRDLQNGQDYELCIDFEAKQRKCFTSEIK